MKISVSEPAPAQQDIPASGAQSGEENERKGRRNWQLHLGANRFFCNGRIVMSRHCSVFLLTIFLISSTTTLFSIFDLPYLTSRVSVLIPIASALLFVLTIVQLLRTSFSDPGILPRASTREVIARERNETEAYASLESGNLGEWAQPKSKVVNICGEAIKLKYCFTCCLFRPPRSSHCSICDNCILNFDHHCPWVANCIGVRNYRHFYLFISFLSFLDLFMGACVILHLILLSNERGNFMNAAKESPISLLICMINFLSIWSIMGLSGFHTYLMAINRTTNEDIKGTFSSKLQPPLSNPYKHKNFFTNYYRILCAPEQPSLMGARRFSKSGETVTIDIETLAKMKNCPTTYIPQSPLSTPSDSEISGRSPESENAVVRNGVPAESATTIHSQKRNLNGNTVVA